MSGPERGADSGRNRRLAALLAGFALALLLASILFVAAGR